MKRFLSLALTPLFLLTSCSSTTPTCFQQHLNKVTATITDTSWYKESTMIPPTGETVHAYFQFEGYDKIVVNGNFDIEFVPATHSDDPARITGDKAFVPHVEGVVLNHTLYLRMDPRYSYKITKPLYVRLPYKTLRNLTYQGTGNVILNKFKSCYFQLNLQGNVNAWIKGDIVLADLDFNSDGKLVMYWINTTALKIHAGKKGTMLLAGIANNLEANLTDSAVLDAKYLRAKDAHIFTQDHSKAEVSVSHDLQMLATGQSNIYYYETPKLMGKYMRESGAIIDMEGVYPPYPKELR